MIPDLWIEAAGFLGASALAVLAQIIWDRLRYWRGRAERAERRLALATAEPPRLDIFV